LKSVKAIGWFIDEYNQAQISMNLTNISITSLHEAFEACRESANRRGIRVTGSELVGLVPKKVLLDAGKYFLTQQNRSLGISEEEIIHIAVKSLGLDELGPFDPRKKIIEYVMKDKEESLITMNLREFANETASESAAPGGGSISAYCGALGISLATMVTNLSANKRGWDERVPYFAEVGEKGQALKDNLLELVDKDTDAFNQIMAAIKMPKSSDEEKAARSAALIASTKNAIEVPLKVMKTAYENYAVLREMANNGNPASASDVGVGALCTHTAIEGAFLNVKINLPGIKDQDYVKDIMDQAGKISASSVNEKDEILKIVESKL
jgi:glutamate formiminotransferase/formiminotetrahydrofolate cyclodeaminase